MEAKAEIQASFLHMATDRYDSGEMKGELRFRYAGAHKNPLGTAKRWAREEGAEVFYTREGEHGPLLAWTRDENGRWFSF